MTSHEILDCTCMPAKLDYSHIINSKSRVSKIRFLFIHFKPAQSSFSVPEPENAEREVHLPTVRMVSPTHMSAPGVSLEVNTDMVWFSSEEFRGIDSSLSLMGLTVESFKCLMQQRVHTESVFYTGGCRHGNFWHALNTPPPHTHTRTHSDLRSTVTRVIWCRRVNWTLWREGGASAPVCVKSESWWLIWTCDHMKTMINMYGGCSNSNQGIMKSDKTLCFSKEVTHAHINSGILTMFDEEIKTGQQDQMCQQMSRQ